MIEWVRKNNPTHLSEWYSLEKHFTYAHFKNLCDKEEFAPFYERAIWHIAKNIRHGGLDKSLAQRFLSLYHRDLAAFERSVKEHESQLRTKEVQACTEEDRTRAQLIVDRLAELQRQARKSKVSSLAA